MLRANAERMTDMKKRLPDLTKEDAVFLFHYAQSLRDILARERQPVSTTEKTLWWQNQTYRNAIEDIECLFDEDDVDLPIDVRVEFEAILGNMRSDIEEHKKGKRLFKSRANKRRVKRRRAEEAPDIFSDLEGSEE